MVLDIEQFRRDFPEFCDSARYPVSMITLWGTVGEQMVSADRFGDLRTQAISLFTAHHISLADQEARASASGKSAGGAGGKVASKSVGSVSVSYDTGNTLELEAGHWNLTTYGQQFRRLVRMFGAGAVVV